MEIQVYGIT